MVLGNSYDRSDIAHLEMVNGPERSDQIYGFQAFTDRLAPKVKTTEEQFIHNIQTVIDSSNSYYSKQATKVLSAVKDHQQEGMIIGMVVTGTRGQLKKLEGLPFIKAATLGATVDMY
ncbi:anti sigma factor C-terminal domain-containing protein [Paenibacillus agri]|uniref:Anti sigma factor C-terminal domain-containing protein n=1 Tax=Paenibacillus agri TaxID=2744309 RepID=A0A850EQZ0_9BACL|nr:anti sigma factor C-terminal domain-containing protein [Paenibacillus agri]NUU62906.1 anti sigma factor C-terminal domain-containing protein [Paenibacillus agri]